MKFIYAALAFLGPGWFGHALGTTTDLLTPGDGVILMLVIPGLAWIVFGTGCLLTLGWSVPATITACLRSMAAGSILLALASLGFYAGLGTGWAVASVLASHFLMMGIFLREGRRLGVAPVRLALVWFLGLDGSALLLMGGVACA